MGYESKKGDRIEEISHQIPTMADDPFADDGDDAGFNPFQTGA